MVLLLNFRYNYN